MAAAPATVDEYLAGLPDDVRARVQALRQAIRDAVPGVTERISYAMPTFDLDGQPLVHVAAWKRHIALYPLPRPFSDPELEDAVAPHRGAKDAMHLPHRQPLPVSVVARVVLELVERRRT